MRQHRSKDRISEMSIRVVQVCTRVNIVECNQRASKDGSLETTDAELKSVQQSHS